MSFRLKGRVIFFATNNVNKFNEARKVLEEYRIVVAMLRVKATEIQSDSLEEIAKASVLEAFGKCRLPLIVEDAGLFVEELNGFPGPYAAYVYKTIGNKGLLRLMENIAKRKATFRSAIAYYSQELTMPMCFRDEVVGEIAKEEKMNTQKSGFGFDPIFKPANSHRTFAEMDALEKNKYSHRAKALRAFAEWYKKLE
jgi:XTP/dITP diphosphohydrolase